MLAQIDWANVAIAGLTAIGLGATSAAFVIKAFIAREMPKRDKSIIQLETWRKIQTEACRQTHEQLNGTVGKVFEKVNEIAEAQAEANGELKSITRMLNGES